MTKLLRALIGAIVGPLVLVALKDVAGDEQAWRHLPLFYVLSLSSWLAYVALIRCAERKPAARKELVDGQS